MLQNAARKLPFLRDSPKLTKRQAQMNSAKGKKEGGTNAFCYFHWGFRAVCIRVLMLAQTKQAHLVLMITLPHFIACSCQSVWCRSRSDGGLSVGLATPVHPRQLLRSSVAVLLALCDLTERMCRTACTFILCLFVGLISSVALLFMLH